MSKLAHSSDDHMEQIEADYLRREGNVVELLQRANERLDTYRRLTVADWERAYQHLLKEKQQ